MTLRGDLLTENHFLQFKKILLYFESSPLWRFRPTVQIPSVQPDNDKQENGNHVHGLFFHFKRHRCTEPVMWLIRKYQGLWRYGVRAQACPTASGAGNVLFVPHSIRSWPFASECSKCSKPGGGGGDDEAGRKKEGRKVAGVEKHDWTKSFDSHTCQ